MINLNLVLTEPEMLKKQLARKGYDVSKLDALADLLQQKKGKQQALDDLRAKRNAWKKDQSIPVEDKRQLRDDIAADEAALADLEAQIRELHLDIPNLPDEDAPEGKTRYVIEKGLYGFRRQKPGYTFAENEKKD